MKLRPSSVTSDGIGIATDMCGSPGYAFTRLLLRRAEYTRSNRHRCPHCGYWHRDPRNITDMGIEGYRCTECT